MNEIQGDRRHYSAVCTNPRHANYLNLECYMVSRPFWKDNCVIQFSTAEIEKIEKFCRMCDLHCECTSRIFCKLCQNLTDAKFGPHFRVPSVELEVVLLNID